MASTVKAGGRPILVIALALAIAACSRDREPAPDAAAMPPPPGAPAAQAVPAATPAAPAPAATTASAAPAPSPGAASAGPSLALLRGYLDAWNAHDIAGAAMFFDENGDYFDSAFAGLQHGRPAIAENAIGVFMRGLPDLKWEVRSDPIVGADGIAFEWTLTGTNTGTWGGVRATGQKIQLKGMSFLRIRNGKIVYQSQVYDSAALNRQLGL
jgi:steroid delta-isomerase-like uncharacterized protein